jgi:hypothetical protein
VNGVFVGARSFWHSQQPSSCWETRETRRFRGACGGAEAESGTPARLQFSWPRPNNSAMAACESPTIAMPTLLRNRS